MAHVGSWEYNIESETFQGSDEGKRIYGLSLDSCNFRVEEVMECVIKTDKVNQALIDLLEKDISYDIKFDIIPCNSEKKKTVRSVAEAEKDGSGNPVKVTGILHDITDLENVEVELKKQLSGKDTLFKGSSSPHKEQLRFQRKPIWKVWRIHQRGWDSSWSECSANS